jgi:hypothetical protein
MVVVVMRFAGVLWFSPENFRRRTVRAGYKFWSVEAAATTTADVWLFRVSSRGIHKLNQQETFHCAMKN